MLSNLPPELKNNTTENEDFFSKANKYLRLDEQASFQTTRKSNLCQSF